jgi:hypothetical protein
MYYFAYSTTQQAVSCPVAQVDDNLRELILCEDSENAELYSAEERSQLLWRCFEHVVLGGPCCQNEVGEAAGSCECLGRGGTASETGS